MLQEALSSDSGHGEKTAAQACQLLHRLCQLRILLRFKDEEHGAQVSGAIPKLQAPTAKLPIRNLKLEIGYNMFRYLKTCPPCRRPLPSAAASQ